jgi:hypothetical protein
MKYTDARKAKARRHVAMARPEFRSASAPRVPAASPVSFPIKVEDPELRRLIDEAIAQRSGE